MTKQYDIKPPENPLEKMLHEPKEERGNVLGRKLAQKGALNNNQLENLDRPNLQSNEDNQSLAQMLGAEDNRQNPSNNKRKKRRRKKRSLLPFHRKKRGPIRKLGKKARHIATFLGLFAFPIVFLVIGISSFLFIGAALNYAHQVEVISTLASPQYYAEMGARGILGGSRKITDIPQDLIGQEPDLNVDYSHNGAMNKHDKLSNSIGSVGGKTGLAIRKSIARAVAKYIGSSHPELVFAQMWAEHGGYEITGEAAKDHNLSGIKFAHQEGATVGESAPGGGDDGNYARFKSWKAYALAYAKLLKKGYPDVGKAKTPAEYAHALKHGVNGAYFQAPESQYATNMSAGVKIYKSHANAGSSITLSGSDDNDTVMFGNNRAKKVDPNDVTTKSGSLNDSNPHRTKRLLYFYSKRLAGNGAGGDSGTEVISGGGAAKLRKIAKSFLGIPYVWGGGHDGKYGMHKSGLDCSGLISMIFWKAGIKQGIMNTIGWEGKVHEVSRDHLQPGDLLFWGPKGGTHHIAMYLGGGKYIQEPEPGQNCEIRPISYNRFDWAGRNDAMNKFVHKHAVIKKKGGKSSGGSGKYNPNADEKWIITRESHGDPHAQNPSAALGTSEHAYGIGQLLPSWYKKYVPGKDWRNNKAVQLTAMRKYIRGRYGNSSKAKAFWMSHGWY